MNIAIIGAGLSGSNMYHLLKKDGHTVSLLEKSRGAGGRCSTRHIGGKLMDHGTPYFKTENKEFIEFCESKINENILVKKDNYYYPTKGINKLCSSMICEDDLIKNTKIISCEFLNDKWMLKDENGVKYENFDKLILTIPAPQILEMDIMISKTLVDKLRNVEYNSIATLLIYSNTKEKLMPQMLVNNSSFKKIIDNSSKYHYDNFSSYVVHLSEYLTNKQNFKNKDKVKKYMQEKIYEIFNIKLEDSFHILPHFWKYAFVSKSLEEAYIYDEQLSLGICGDYFNHTDLEGSYLSSKSLYEQKFR